MTWGKYIKCAAVLLVLGGLAEAIAEGNDQMRLARFIHFATAWFAGKWYPRDA